MFCKSYSFVRNEMQNNELKNIVWCEIYADTTPSPLPSDASDIDNFPKSFDPKNVIFAPGSVLYVIGGGTLYMADSTGAWIQQ